MLKRQLTRFTLVGAFGFLVDAGVLYLCLHVAELGLYLGRIVSYLAAATTTWYLNRRLTFDQASSAPPVRQWLKFITANGLGGVVNYGTYSLTIELLPPHTLTPLLGVALGSIAGLGFNFTMSRYVVFASGLPPHPSGEGDEEPLDARTIRGTDGSGARSRDAAQPHAARAHNAELADDPAQLPPP